MLYRGDFVRHNTFPPVEGYVSLIEEMPLGTPNKVAVLYNKDKLYWDGEDTWELLKESPIIDDVIIEVDSKKSDYESIDMSDVIDVDYKEI